MQYTISELATRLDVSTRTVNNHLRKVEATFGIEGTQKIGRSKVLTTYAQALVVLSIRGTLDRIQITDSLIDEVNAELETAAKAPEVDNPGSDEVVEGEIVVFGQAPASSLVQFKSIGFELGGLEAITTQNLELAKVYEQEAQRLRLEVAVVSEQAQIKLEQAARARVRAESELEEARRVHDEALGKLRMQAQTSV